MSSSNIWEVSKSLLQAQLIFLLCRDQHTKIDYNFADLSRFSGLRINMSANCSQTIPVAVVLLEDSRRTVGLEAVVREHLIYHSQLPAVQPSFTLGSK